MPIFEFGKDSIEPLKPTHFGQAGIKERSDLQRLLRDQIEIVAPDVLVIAEEFGEWVDARRRIDLLGIDRDANLVVIELKRTEDGGHMELQAVRYAAMVSTLTANRALEIFAQYLAKRGRNDDPEQTLMEFLQWDALDEDQFGQDVRIVLVSENFSRELTTAVMWLNEKDLDIRCVRIHPYAYENRTLIDVQQVIPLPEATEYQVQVREKKRQERQARNSKADFTRYDVTFDGKTHRDQWKRNAILLVVKHLIERGTTPDEIQRVIAPVGKNRLWWSVEGEVRDGEEFEALAVVDAEKRGIGYNNGRWHTREGDLIVHEGRTFAFTNQWGRHWPPAMNRLKQHYEQHEIVWVPSGEQG